MESDINNTQYYDIIIINIILDYFQAIHLLYFKAISLFYNKLLAILYSMEAFQVNFGYAGQPRLRIPVMFAIVCLSFVTTGWWDNEYVLWGLVRTDGIRLCIFVGSGQFYFIAPYEGAVYVPGIFVQSV